MHLKKQYPILYIIIGILGISSSAILVKLSSAPSVITALYRLVWTVALMTPVVFGKAEVRREFRLVSLRDYALAALSGTLLAVHFATWFESLKRTSVASSTVIVCTEVIWVALGFCLFLHGHISRKAIYAIAVTFFGSVLVACLDSSAGGAIWGDLLALIAAIAVAGYTLLGRELRGYMSTTVYTYIVYCCCSVVLLVFSLLLKQPLIGYGIGSLVCGLLLAVFCTLLGHSMFSYCLKFFSPTFVSAAKLCEPVISSLFAAILFAEIPAPLQLLGSAGILGGVIWYSILESRGEG